LTHNLLQDKFDFSIGDLYLPTSLRIVRCGQLECDGIFLHKSFKRSVAEMSTTFADFSMRGSEAQENVFFKDLTTILLLLILLGMSSTHLYK